MAVMATSTYEPAALLPGHLLPCPMSQIHHQRSLYSLELVEKPNATLSIQFAVPLQLPAPGDVPLESPMLTVLLWLGSICFEKAHWAQVGPLNGPTNIVQVFITTPPPWWYGQ